MADVAPGSAQMEDFKLGKPALVCRWRLAAGRLALENRHMRALGARELGGEPVSPQLVAWAKQHVEWTLRDGSFENPNGTLMLIIDEAGQAAMTVGPYEPLPNADSGTLFARAIQSSREAEATGVAPETLWLVRDGGLVCGLSTEATASGASSLVWDLAKTVGLPVSREDGLATSAAAGLEDFDEAFLVSDEHGVVMAADASGETGRRLQEGYQKLLDSMRDGRR